MKKLSVFLTSILLAAAPLFAQGIAPVDSDENGKLEIASKANLLYLSANAGADWDADYEQTADIVFGSSDFELGGDFYNDGKGFSPIGINDDTPFTGSYDGQGHTIDGLYINRGANEYIGLFGWIGESANPANIEDLGLTNASVEANGSPSFIGALVGTMSFSSTISQCFSTGSVESSWYYVGGLVGHLVSGTINNSYSKCSVNGFEVGGLIGICDGDVNNCYACGPVSGLDHPGGLIGGTNGDGWVIIDCYWNTDTIANGTGYGSPTGLTGLTTAQFQDQSNFTNWDFAGESANGTDEIWNIDSELNDGIPYLDWQYPVEDVPLPITLASFTATVKNGTVELAWETATETNNARFVIYRNDEAIGSVEGAGTCSEPHNYTFVDNAVVPGVSYTYVLADVDYANVVNKYETNAVTLTITENEINTDFVLGNAYPNPFNPRVAIGYQLSAAGLVKAAVYNSNGVIIEELLNDDMSAGSHELTWDASNMPSGIYIVRATAGDKICTQKIALIK